MKNIKIYVLLLAMIAAGTIGFVSCQKQQKEVAIPTQNSSVAKQDVIAVFENHEQEIKENLHLIAVGMTTLIQEPKIKSIIKKEALLKAVDNIHAVMFLTLEEECQKEKIDITKKMEEGLLSIGTPVNKAKKIKQILTHFKAGNQDLYPRIYIPWYDSTRFNPTFWDKNTPKTIMISQRHDLNAMPTWVINSDRTISYTTKDKNYANNNPVWFIEVRHTHYLNNEIDKWFSRAFPPCFCKPSTDTPSLLCQNSQGGGTDCYMVRSDGSCLNLECLPANLKTIPDPKGLNKELNQAIEELIKKYVAK
ncbi:MAG: hypothetical protein NZ455_04300 [Bacteroidia bacterium]|nr:hypothetical protein [Bacteroidia bacterium]